ncbi:unnamed protein product [Staurois parvus]|uniref:Uncharacterized protein n=1 Tax=Staurois parvus TaxID=386267 RepID=A0ABN9DX91_9NEOB|nr:unnamed protein product [Staurois parvus]
MVRGGVTFLYGIPGIQRTSLWWVPITGSISPCVVKTWAQLWSFVIYVKVRSILPSAHLNHL